MINNISLFTRRAAEALPPPPSASFYLFLYHKRDTNQRMTHELILVFISQTAALLPRPFFGG